jgi:hypothetical protein
LPFCALFLPVSAQTGPPSELPPPVNFTAQQDHQNMMDQLGIKALRPGPSGDENAPNHANYDESLANPYPNLPDILTLKNGEKVATSAVWWQQRRPEIVEDMERQVYRRISANVPRVTWSVFVGEREMVGRIPANARKLIGHVDNSAYPFINVNISMVLVTPANATGPVPVPDDVCAQRSSRSRATAAGRYRPDQHRPSRSIAEAGPLFAIDSR